MKNVLKTLAAIAALALPSTASAQDTVEATVGADIVSNYIWRGQDLGGAAIQPSVGLSYKGISLSAWGSYGIIDRNDTKEFDLTLSYTTGGLTVGITDYFCTSGTANCPAKYFLYDAHQTAHTFEANIGYDFGKFSLNWFTNIAGADGISSGGSRAYASYIEAAAPFTLGGLEWEAQLGAVPFKDGGFYTDKNAYGFAVTNITLKASKEINITPTFTVPMFGAITANPSTQSIFFTAGISL